jgi:hypothetical protein
MTKMSKRSFLVLTAALTLAGGMAGAAATALPAGAAAAPYPCVPNGPGWPVRLLWR